MKRFGWRRLARVAWLATLLQGACRDGRDEGASEPPSAVPMASSGLEPASGPRPSPGGSGDQSALCRSDRDCPVDATCCPSGLIGVCTPLAAGRGCPEPDLALVFPDDFKPRFEDRFVYGDDCLLQKCFSGQGARRLLTFPIDLANRGEADMILGLPDTPGVRRVSCDGSLFIDDLLRYELIDAAGVRRAGGAGNVANGCRLDDMAQSTSPFDCQTLGLEARSYRSYAAADDCQWVDITTLPAGEYTLRVSVNADRRIAERDLGNNVLERRVTIPDRDLLGACEEDVPEDIGFGDGIECGWEFMPGQTSLPCVPEEFVSMECTFCNGAYVPRACPGLEPCSTASSLRINYLGDAPGICSSEHACDGFGQCTDFEFRCPASGVYTLLGFPTAPVLPTGSAPPSAPNALFCRRSDESEAFAGARAELPDAGASGP